MMTIEERDTARAIQAIARKLREPVQIDWEARKWELAKELYVRWCNHPDGMVRREALTECGRADCVREAEEFIRTYKNNQVINPE